MGCYNWIAMTYVHTGGRLAADLFGIRIYWFRNLGFRGYLVFLEFIFHHDGAENIINNT